MFRNPTVDVILVLVVVLLIFGPKRIPTIMSELGRGMREFKDAITGGSKDDKEGERPEITRAGAGADGVAGSTGADAPAREAEPRSAQGTFERRT